MIAAVEDAAKGTLRDAEAGDYEGAARRLEAPAGATGPLSDELEDRGHPADNG